MLDRPPKEVRIEVTMGITVTTRNVEHGRNRASRDCRSGAFVRRNLRLESCRLLFVALTLSLFPEGKNSCKTDNGTA
jgi:hypothetical protein